MSANQSTRVSAVHYIQSPLPRQTANIVLGDAEKEALYTLGYVLYQQGKYDEAIPFFLLLNLHDSNHAKYYAALAACQKMTGEYEKAINNYASALVLQPGQIEYILHIAECQIAAQYAEGAINTLTQLLQLEIPHSNPDQTYISKAKTLLGLLATKH